jgi:V-type H+-transporting ATPase subunit a
MGFFATYCGIIYNDLFAVPLWLFDSCYPLTYLPKTADINDHEAWEMEHQKFTTKQEVDCTYPIGIDPVWHMGKNDLTYTNSLKMKLSVIFGVL